MRLHQRALRLQEHLNSAAGVRRALPGLAYQVVNGVLDKPPQFFEGLTQPGALGYRDFISLQEISLVDAILSSVEYDSAYRLLCRSA
jgi:hypothetical protein